MGDLNVRMLGEDDWAALRQIRLQALRDAPEAFVARYEDEAGYDERFWRERLRKAPRFIAQHGDKSVGIVGLGLHNDDPDVGEVFGLWSAPQARGAQVAAQLVRAAAAKAAEDGMSRLVFWVGSDNAAGIGFASNFGFRPTSERRPMRVGNNADQAEDEVAMVISLAADPTLPINPHLP